MTGPTLVARCLTAYWGNDQPAISAAVRAEQASLSDPWEGAIAAVLEKRPADITGGMGQDELIEQALCLSADKISRDVQMRVTRIVTGSDFLTHGGTVRWKQQKRRYGGGKPRSGYTPLPTEKGPAAAGRSLALADLTIDAPARMQAVLALVSDEVRTWAPAKEQARICHTMVHEIADRLLRDSDQWTGGANGTNTTTEP